MGDTKHTSTFFCVVDACHELVEIPLGLSMMLKLEDFLISFGQQGHCIVLWVYTRMEALELVLQIEDINHKCDSLLEFSLHGQNADHTTCNQLCLRHCLTAIHMSHLPHEEELAAPTGERGTLRAGWAQSMHTNGAHGLRFNPSNLPSPLYFDSINDSDSKINIINKFRSALNMCFYSEGLARQQEGSEWKRAKMSELSIINVIVCLDHTAGLP